MCRACLPCGAPRSQGCKDSGDRGAYVVAEDDGDGSLERNDTLGCEGYRKAYGCGARLYEQSEEGSGGQPHKGISAEFDEDILAASEKRHGGFHGLHADEKQAETKNPCSDGFIFLPGGGEMEDDADDDEEIGVVLHTEREDLARHRSAYVGAHDDADGLHEVHDARLDEAHRHDGRGGAALYDDGCGRAEHDAQQRGLCEHADDAAKPVACRLLK